MLDTLQKMSGTTHRTYTDSKTITRDSEAIFKNLSANEGKVSYTMTTKEVPVISYNDMAFISERNSIIFRAGDSPIWNRNETILPMSWRLFKDTITQPGKEYTLQTIPTLSSAIDFDIRQNQPDFSKMLDKRMNQACVAGKAKDAYKAAYEYTDYEISQLEQDENYSDEIMDIINTYLRQELANESDEDDFDYDYDDEFGYDDVEDNIEQQIATEAAKQQYNTKAEKKYAGGMLSSMDLVSMGGQIDHKYDSDLIKAYLEVKGDMSQDSDFFIYRNGSLYDTANRLLILRQDDSNTLQQLNQAAKDEHSRMFSDDDIKQEDLSAIGSYCVTDEFYRFLVNCDAWTFAKGRFDEALAKILKQ